MLRIALIGAGRMGQAVMLQIAAAPDLALAGVCAREQGKAAAADAIVAAGLDSGVPVVADPAKIVPAADVVIDFSLPRAVGPVIAAAIAARKPLVCGVTGLDDAAVADIQAASQKIPLLYDRNMSIGIAVLSRLLQQACAALGSDFSASVAETHHRHKVDAPSGTALKLGEIVAKGRGQDFASVYRYDPQGKLGEPGTSDIVYAVRREGDNPGEHRICFTSDSESLELIHKVTDRKVFAEGAIRAARWLVAQPEGLYNVGDIAA
jgi:4-hydroxy-tetrahydrodipicolinate reductase